MIWYVAIGALAAFGLACALWVGFGWLLPGAEGGVLVCLCTSGSMAEGFLRRFRWLRDLGLLRAPLLLVRQGVTPEEEQRLRRRYPEIEFCGPEELASRLELERKRLG